MSATTGPSESLASILRTERLRDGEYAVSLEDFWGASMACDGLARAALAAAESCPGRELHSLHAWFNQPAPPGTALSLRLDRLGEDRQFARRRARLEHGERLLCEAILSFVTPAAGMSYQGAVRDADLPDPESAPSTAERAKAEGWADFARGPIEFRRIGAAWPWPKPASTETSVHREWVRPRQALPRDPHLQMAALVFLSDFYSHWTASDRLGADFRPDRVTQLDHALWVHRHVPWDGWWLLKAVSEAGRDGRLFTRREIYTSDGILVASAAQEAFYAAAVAEDV